MGTVIGNVIGVPFSAPFSWASYWSHQSEVLFFAETKNIADGKLYNQKFGATDYLTIGGTVGSYTFQCPNIAPYIAADTDYIWFKTNAVQRTTTTAELIGYDFARTIVKYDNTSPYVLREIIILSEALTTAEMNHLRDYADLSIWWNNTLSFHGSTKQNRTSQQSVWTPELTGFKMAQNFTARMSVTPITAVNTLLVNLCTNLISTGLWIKGDYLLLGRLHTSQASLLNVFQDRFNGSILGGMIYSEKLGWYGDGVNGSVLLVDYKVGDGLASLNDNASLINILETIAEAKCDFGSSNGTDTDAIWCKDSGTGDRTLLYNQAAGVHITASRGSIIGLHTNSRTESTDFIYYFNNAIFDIDATPRASVALTGYNDVGGGENSGGSYTYCSTKRFDILGRFQGLTAQNVSDLYDIITAFNNGMAATSLYDSYTKSMLHFNGKDASSVITDETSKVWTIYEQAQIDTAQKKFGTGALLLDGTGDYIDTPDHADFALGNEDFTIDFWLKRNSKDAYMGIVGQGNSSDATDTSFYMQFNDTNVIQLGCFTGVTQKYIISAGIITDTINWHHIALVRYGNIMKLYIDGIVDVNTRDMTGVTVNNSNKNLTIGKYIDYANYYFNGWIDEFRFSKGIARWTADFTPPVAEY